jgi:hypothetical protein
MIILVRWRDQLHEDLKIASGATKIASSRTQTALQNGLKKVSTKTSMIN